jgi:hypothetical protein
MVDSGNIVIFKVLSVMLEYEKYLNKYSVGTAQDMSDRPVFH